MEPIPHNFYFDPIRQGAGRGIWNWFSGSPFQTGGYLTLLNGRGQMYYDCGKGCTTFTLNVPTDSSVADRQWGLKASDDYIFFDVSSGVFSAKTYSTFGQLATAVVIPWDANWTGTDTVFMIRWEAGIVTFYINQIKRAQISDASVPCGPMSPYVSSDGGDLFLIKNVLGQGLQTLILNPVEAAADIGTLFSMPSDKLTLSENITSVATLAGLSGIADTISTASDVATVVDEMDYAPTVVDSSTMTENIVISRINTTWTIPSVYDTITPSELTTVHTV